jgi:hypothetical protein
MTSYRQIEADRRNALNSTGPKTEAGKRASRCNAKRTAENITESRRNLLSVLLMTQEVADLAEGLSKLGAKVTHDSTSLPILRTRRGST